TATEVDVDATFEIETVYLLNRTILTGDGNTVTTATGTYYKVSGSEYYVNTTTYVPGTTKFYTISGEPGSEVATVYTGEVVFTIAQ
ncbi:MAG: hypothetical protein J6Z34_01470, partial [Clostridia bacterium]|nr:hypothetical protein [Clostridia bacterium]